MQDNIGRKTIWEIDKLVMVEQKQATNAYEYIWQKASHRSTLPAKHQTQHIHSAFKLTPFGPVLPKIINLKPLQRFIPVEQIHNIFEVLQHRKVNLHKIIIQWVSDWRDGHEVASNKKSSESILLRDGDVQVRCFQELCTEWAVT